MQAHVADRIHESILQRNSLVRSHPKDCQRFGLKVEPVPTILSLSIREWLVTWVAR